MSEKRERMTVLVPIWLYLKAKSICEARAMNLTQYVIGLMVNDIEGIRGPVKAKDAHRVYLPGDKILRMGTMVEVDAKGVPLDPAFRFVGE